MTTPARLALILGAALLLSATSLHAVTTYTFEGLTTGIDLRLPPHALSTADRPNRQQ